MSHIFQITSKEEYQSQYAQSVQDPETFWAQIADQFLWRKKWDRVLDWNFDEPQVQWFSGAKLNITENCLDRHLTNFGNKTALIWEPNDPKEASRTFTYRELHSEVCKMSNILKIMGVRKGDRVCIYLPMIPELSFAVLACARIGAVHSVVFAGFSAHSIADRINDSQCAFVITSDGINRGAKQIPAKAVVDEALEHCTSVEKVLVVNSLNWPVHLNKERDVLYSELYKEVTDICEAQEMDSEDMLFILYTSGSTGKPKGVVHTCGGYMVYTGYSFANVFQYRKNEIFWCTADIGWITGHSYILYGPLLMGATTFMFEGIPTYPDPGRFWQIIDKHSIHIFYTAPTAIRSLMASGIDHVLPYNLHSLRVLGSVGEPINEEAWHWYFNHIGKGRCPVVDTWWQTETGGIMISALAGISDLLPAHAGLPLPGIQPVLVDAQGIEITENDVEGYLCMKFPWPSIIRTTYGDHERCRINYFATYKGLYFTGDGARRDKNGLYRIIGRVDDVINVSGHRFGTAEIENAINQNKKVIESAVIGYPHDIKGQGIYAYIILANPLESNDQVRDQIIETVSEQIGRIAKPDKIQFVSALPKTRSGKIMRRILRKIAEGELSALGDTSTLLDPTVVDEIVQGRF
ncbi:MAG: acetate--CoA ligase [Flavobacteriales bacterium]|nr:acetate--CoA ligase [Flavobacteriales bacterium]